MPDAETSTPIWIVDDEPAAARLAADLCIEHGAQPSVFSGALAYLSALRDGRPPHVVVLDWRLEHELSAALYLATRHRYPRLPVVYWTGSVVDSLPLMIREDAMTVVVDKAAGSEPFDRAISWALSATRAAD